MKRCILPVLAIWFATHTFLPSIFAQGSPQWSLPEGVKARLGKGRISEIAYSPDRMRLAVASSLGIWLYDTETYQEVALLTGDTVNSISFSADGQMLASENGDGTVRLWNTNTGTILRQLSGHSNDIHSVVFSRDGKMLASGSKDASVRLWDARTGRFLPTLRGHFWGIKAVAFSPDSKTVASGDNNMIFLWNWRKLEKTQE